MKWSLIRTENGGSACDPDVAAGLPRIAPSDTHGGGTNVNKVIVQWKVLAYSSPMDLEQILNSDNYDDWTVDKIMENGIVILTREVGA